MFVNRLIASAVAAVLAVGSAVFFFADMFAMIGFGDAVSFDDIALGGMWVTGGLSVIGVIGWVGSHHFIDDRGFGHGCRVAIAITGFCFAAFWILTLDLESSPQGFIAKSVMLAAAGFAVAVIVPKALVPDLQSLGTLMAACIPAIGTLAAWELGFGLVWALDTPLGMNKIVGIIIAVVCIVSSALLGLLAAGHRRTSDEAYA